MDLAVVGTASWKELFEIGFVGIKKTLVSLLIGDTWCYLETQTGNNGYDLNNMVCKDYIGKVG